MHVSVTHLDRLSPSYAYALGNLCGITLCIIQNSSDVRLILKNNKIKTCKGVISQKTQSLAAF